MARWRWKIRRLSEIGRGRRALLIEAVILLALARLALLLVPFPRLARRLGTLVAPSDYHAAPAYLSASEQDIALAREIGWAVTRAARHVPFRAACLPQAMAARVMLRRRQVPSVLHLGAAKTGDATLGAHAWLDATGVEVTGYPVGEQFAEIGGFV